MVEGMIVANGLEGTEATRARTALWAAVVADPDLADEGRLSRFRDLFTPHAGDTARTSEPHLRLPRAPARVAELADAEGLNPSGASAPCGSDPTPGTL